MDGTPSAIRVAGRSKLELLELSRDVGPDVLRVETQALDGSKFGIEPITIAVLTVGVAGLRVLAAWLLQERHHDRIEKTVEFEYPDGGKVTKTILIELDAGAPPDVAVAKALAELMHLELPVAGLQTAKRRPPG